MKKILLSLIGAACLMALHAQTPAMQDRDALNLSSFVGYPLTIGDVSTDQLQMAVNKLLPVSVEQDSLARYQIGAIPDQTVWHAGDITVGFYVLTDTLKAKDVALSYTIDSIPAGKIEFNEQTGRFKYSPDIADARNFTVTFRAEANGNLIVQDVLFTLMPATPPKFDRTGVTPMSLPDSGDKYYRTIATTSQFKAGFNSADKTVYIKSISGKNLIFDSRLGTDELQDLNNASDLYELNLYADSVIIRNALHFPQTNITVYAKVLIFEDLPGQDIASINTTPLTIGGPTNDSGNDGAKAGNITLYIKDYEQTSPAKRFILVGGSGQNSNRNGTPGNGGDGGMLTSTVDVSNFCDLIHGSAGIGSDDSGAIIKAGEKNGQDGSFELNDKEFAWLHPNFISAVVKYAKDAYLNLNNNYANNIFNEYTGYIKELKEAGEWDALDEAEQIDLTSLDSDMKSLIYRIGQNLDYFGNPQGWVPMLSFEVNETAFEQEIEKAIPVMYLSYWIQKIDNNNADLIAGANEAVNSTINELRDNEALVQTLVLNIPVLEDELASLRIQIDDVKQKIDQKYQELLAKAKDNVEKRHRWDKVVSGLKAIASIAPIVMPIGGTVAKVATDISIAANLGASAISIATGYLDNNQYYSFYDQAYDMFSGFIDKNDSIVKASSGVKKDDVRQSYQIVNQDVTSIMNDIAHLQDVFSKSSAPADEISAELNKLEAESQEFQALNTEFQALTSNATVVTTNLQKTFSDVASANTDIQKNIASIDGLTDDVFTGDSKRDLRAMQYIGDMEHRARERLLKYHYYMAKAYEYRLLKDYPGVLNLSAIADRCLNIIDGNPGRMTLDLNVPLDANDFQNIKSVYDEQISTVTSTILDEYENKPPELGIDIEFALEKNEIDALNAGQSISFNMIEKGWAQPYEENVRIRDIKVKDFKFHVDGTLGGGVAYTDLLLEHSGNSKLRKEGKIYQFSHLNSQNQNPIIWGMRYQARSGEVTPIEPSAASQSLLYSLLDKLGKKDSIMIYSRPGAWSDITISKNDNVTGNAKIVIDEITFDLQYDFTRRPTNNRNLDVYAGDVDNSNTSLSPYIELSKTDIGGRDNGRGVLYRTYGSSSSVNLNAPSNYGRYKFVNWTDRYGTVVSTNATISANMSNDAQLTANYKYTGPILSVEDSVLVGKSAQVIAVKVENKGSEEMDWTAVSNTPWIKILSDGEGTDTGYITLEIEQNPSETFRNGSITITAPETAEYAKDIKIVQSNENVTDLKQIELPHSPKIIRNTGTNTYTVWLDETARNISVDVYAVSGQLVLRKYFYGTSTFDFDLSHCNQGVYLVKIAYDEKNCVKKLIR